MLLIFVSLAGDCILCAMPPSAENNKELSYDERLFTICEFKAKVQIYESYCKGTVV